MHYANSQDKTYYGAVNKNGDIVIHAYDHVTGNVSGPYTLSVALQVDDHAQPSILIRTDGKLLVFYASHNGSKAYCRVSAGVEDISAWGNVVDVTPSGQTVSYPSPIQLTGEENNPVYCIYRGIVSPATEREVVYAKSTDGGATWAAPVRVFAVTGQRPYFHVAQNGTARIDFIVTDGHPNEIATNSLYHFYYSGGNYYKSDGTQIIASLPFTAANVTKIYDGITDHGWVWDVAIDSAGYPRCVFATFPDATTDHRYQYAFWNGSAWTIREICAAGGPLYSGETYYSGGISLNHSNTNEVYLSKNLGSGWDIWKYVTADDGATWTATQITNDAALQFRPVIPRDAQADLPVVWLEGRYTSYTDFDTDVKPHVVA